ncbi:hypothetical protein BDE36_3754 [Arcticibacter tournemirensis]|uniref:DUF7281 domain-containing protein n=1 Tax=Arcticibacter tournemirensis TaxID=699437 RepID=A0A5M9H880_9SPHI|nr:hypothetical protein [Arcticibacter tournemirensis]KAA8483126.1 hypothetical protein F1649_09960 [Arcticibacter tournemirensis]TQM51960.1 hypothetical protein BDE36_3754 [Arcticibacter tournemirensis]
MQLSSALADKLLRLAHGERLPASSLKFALVAELISEGIIIDQRKGRTKSTLYVPDPVSLRAYINNRFSISDLEAYLATLRQDDFLRADLARHASDSKRKVVRTFKGFLVNSYQPVVAMLGGKEIIIQPPPGTFQFIHNYETFVPDPDVLIVNVENAENFSRIAEQRHLFEEISPLFVSRYPQNQNKDLLNWLRRIPNSYLHFGDFDFAGINIYLNEYKRSLGERAKFFIPNDIESLIARFGNRKLYDRQKKSFHASEVDERGILELSQLLHRYKKGLEQEVLIQLV